GDHGHRAGRRDSQGAEARRPHHRQYGRDRVERSFRRAGARLHARPEDRSEESEPRWRRDRPGSPTGRHRRAHHRQGCGPAQARRQAVRALDPMHRRRPGHRHHPGGGVMTIEKAAVIGAGVMGSGIAAQIATAGVPVLLLDIVPEGATDRSAIAKGAIDKLLKADPAPLMSKAAAKLITPGNLEDDLDKLKDVDWIVEAVLEKLEIKQALFRKIEPFRKKGSIASSNT